MVLQNQLEVGNKIHPARAKTMDLEVSEHSNSDTNIAYRAENPSRKEAQRGNRRAERNHQESDVWQECNQRAEIGCRHSSIC